MKHMKLTVLTMVTVFVASCQSTPKKSTTADATAMEVEEVEKLSPQELSKYETAYFASGCFWCVEAIFESVKGVKEAVSGYSGGEEENPTYEMIGYGKPSHAEAVEVYYDPEVISFTALVQVFFGLGKCPYVFLC